MDTPTNDPLLDPVTRVGASWGWYLLGGIILFVLGLIALFEPKKATTAVFMLFALALIVSGVFDIVGGIAARGAEGGMRWMAVITGIVGLVLGVLLWRNRAELLIGVLGVFLGIYWLIHGVMLIVTAVTGSGEPGRWLRLVLGLLQVVVGAYVLGSPSTGTALIVWLLGLMLLLTGIAEVVIAFQVKGAGT